MQPLGWTPTAAATAAIATHATSTTAGVLTNGHILNKLIEMNYLQPQTHFLFVIFSRLAKFDTVHKNH